MLCGLCNFLVVLMVMNTQPATNKTIIFMINLNPKEISTGHLKVKELNHWLVQIPADLSIEEAPLKQFCSSIDLCHNANKWLDLNSLGFKYSQLDLIVQLYTTGYLIVDKNSI